MRYWDASALVALLVAEPDTERMRALLREDSSIVTWVWTKVEIASAVERRTRQGELTRTQRRTAIARLDELAGSWDEVTDALAVRRRAVPLLARHPLRAADAAQLAAALLIAPETGPAMGFVCLDERLGETAEREGLVVVPASVDP